MAPLQLLHHRTAKNALQNRSFLHQPARIPGASPVPAARPSCPARSGLVLGVHVTGILDLPVVQQPAGDDAYVSPVDGQLTQFRLPSSYGNVGLLAHNVLSGRLFSRLARGQEVHLLYGNGALETFAVTGILRCQALQPANPYGPLRDLDTDETLTVKQLFEMAYMGSRHVTFQTCIAASGSSTWGRLFVIAARQKTPASQPWN